MMTKEQILAHQKSGTPVWFIEKWSDRIVCAKVVEIRETDDGSEYAELHGLGGSPDRLIDFTGSTGRKFADLFASKEELETHLEEKKAAEIAEIRAQIQSKDDMVRFMFTHPVACCEEYTDWTAREAVVAIAREKWNINLE